MSLWTIPGLTVASGYQQAQPTAEFQLAIPHKSLNKNSPRSCNLSTWDCKGAEQTSVLLGQKKTRSEPYQKFFQVSFCVAKDDNS
ncbi:hypothetical protein AAFF_G00182300 [Aldrovandia affinis]|uniref:Uncharacterized protein n=1 Tax=Aldrovandia affinis TaxID=143900 RepID=A0AAD7RK62_9TELE|nr:hypothetical protein AAFF_G00182300 [Aldrovandia affinis]